MSLNNEADACLSFHKESQDYNLSALEIGDIVECPAVWDGYTCWGPTTAGATATRLCPTLKGIDSNNKAIRLCGVAGRWLDRNGIPNDIGWTNFTPCYTPEIREIMRRLGSEDEVQKKLRIAQNTRILEYVGLSFSLIALVISLVIFRKFRTLRNSRTRLHRHLFIAMVIQVAIRLTLYIDQAITRAGYPENKMERLSQENLQGIDNTPILCEAGYICLEYARTAMFFWMFVEGCHLHRLITVTVFEVKLSPVIYSIVGWIVPIPLTATWAIVTAINYGTATCWWGYSLTLYFWILEGPRLGVLMVNLAFLLNILRVLVTKLRRSNSSETHQARKAVKAALLLLPLLGLTNLVTMIDAPLEKSAWVFGLWSYSTHLLTSCQGFILACLYCFCNGEVQMALKKYFRTRIMGRNKLRLPSSSIRMSLLNNSTVVAGNGDGNRVLSNHANHNVRVMVQKLNHSKQDTTGLATQAKAEHNNKSGAHNKGTSSASARYISKGSLKWTASVAKNGSSKNGGKWKFCKFEKCLFTTTTSYNGEEDCGQDDSGRLKGARMEDNRRERVLCQSRVVVDEIEISSETTPGDCAEIIVQEDVFNECEQGINISRV